MLELQNICYRVSTPEGELDILRDISITIPDQRLMVFTGPNGGGKTTLAKIIMGLVQPTSGRILYNGQCSPRTKAILRSGTCRAPSPTSTAMPRFTVRPACAPRPITVSR